MSQAISRKKTHGFKKHLMNHWIWIAKWKMTKILRISRKTLQQLTSKRDVMRFKYWNNHWLMWKMFTKNTKDAKMNELCEMLSELEKEKKRIQDSFKESICCKRKMKAEKELANGKEKKLMLKSLRRASTRTPGSGLSSVLCS